MCRYAGRYYKDHFACFQCRKSYKYSQWHDGNVETVRRGWKWRHVPRQIPCPNCKTSMTDMGWDFRAPRERDVEAWAIMELLQRAGFRFGGCGCDVGFTPPRKLRDVPGWLAGQRRVGGRERLSEAFAGRKASKRAAAR
jgi:hypothetical protein